MPPRRCQLTLFVDCRPYATTTSGEIAQRTDRAAHRPSDLSAQNVPSPIASSSLTAAYLEQQYRHSAELRASGIVDQRAKTADKSEARIETPEDPRLAQNLHVRPHDDSP